MLGVSDRVEKTQDGGSRLPKPVKSVSTARAGRNSIMSVCPLSPQRGSGDCDRLARKGGPVLMPAFSDLALIVATLGGPIFAVQAQTFLERRRSAASRRLNVFRTLLATRGARLAATHVEALNLIDVEFYEPTRRVRRQNAKLRRVRSSWKAYYDHLASAYPMDKSEEAVYLNQRNELFVDLLYEMSIAVGYTEIRWNERDRQNRRTGEVVHGDGSLRPG